MNKSTVYVTGSNVLVEIISKDEVTSSGIIVTISESEDTLIQARVVNKGPGFLLPLPKVIDNEITALIGGSQETTCHIIPLDIEIGDIVYFSKGSIENVLICSKQYAVIPYHAIKIYVRDSRCT